MSEQKKYLGTIRIDDAQLILKNFSGRGTDFNDEGKRNFGVLLEDPQMVEDLIEDGWPVKFAKEREDNPGFRQPWLPVKVKFGTYPPNANLIMVDEDGVMHRRKLDEEEIGELDHLQAKKVDLLIRPYSYPAIRGRPAGISAYLKAIYFTLLDDDLEARYSGAVMDD